MRKPKAAPFAPLHRDYYDSLQAVLLAAGMLETTAQTLLDLDQVSETGRRRLTEVLAEYRRAWDGP